MDKKQNLSRAQEKAKSFIEEYQVEKVISEMLNSLVHSRDPKPIIFMIKYLASLVTEQELDENGIVVTGPMPQRIPIITYPKFDQECNSLLKKHLTREIWANMKKKSTTKGGNIQLCVKSGVQKPQFPIGAMATDEEAYKSFGDLFQPIIKDLHQEFDHRFSYKFDELKFDLIEEQLNNMKNCMSSIDDFRFELSRNFRGTPFTPLMTKEAKLKVERKVVEVLGQLYGQYNQVHKISEEDTEWLTSIGIDPQNKNEEFDAAGINDDWPVGRGIFIQDQRNFLVLVNFEQHIKIIVLKDKNDQADTMTEGLRRLVKMTLLFEKLGFATDSYLGNLSVSPKDLGTAMKLFCEFGLTATSNELDRQIMLKLIHDSKIDYVRLSNSNHTMSTQKTLAAGMNEMIQIAEYLKLVKKVCNNLDAQTKEH